MYVYTYVYIYVYICLYIYIGRYSLLAIPYWLFPGCLSRKFLCDNEHPKTLYVDITANAVYVIRRMHDMDVFLSGFIDERQIDTAAVPEVCGVVMFIW